MNILLEMAPSIQEMHIKIILRNNMPILFIHEELMQIQLQANEELTLQILECTLYIQF